MFVKRPSGLHQEVAYSINLEGRYLLQSRAGGAGACNQIWKRSTNSRKNRRCWSGRLCNRHGINKGIGALVGVNKQSDKWYEGGVGGWLGEKLYDLFNPETAKLLNKNSMPAPIVNNISIQIDKEDRVTDKTDNMNTKTNINALNENLLMAETYEVR